MAKSGKRNENAEAAGGEKTKLKIISLGGVNEIGKNLTVYEYGPTSYSWIAAGLSRRRNAGIDIVIPDFTYLVKNRDRIRGLMITHGHEDHVGAIPIY